MNRIAFVLVCLIGILVFAFANASASENASKPKEVVAVVEKP